MRTATTTDAASSRQKVSKDVDAATAVASVALAAACARPVKKLLMLFFFTQPFLKQLKRQVFCLIFSHFFELFLKATVTDDLPV